MDIHQNNENNNSLCNEKYGKYSAFETIIGYCNQPSIDIWNLGCIICELILGTNK